MEIFKNDKIVYVFGNTIICEKVISVRKKLDDLEIKLSNGWHKYDKRFHKVPNDFKEGIYSKSK